MVLFPSIAVITMPASLVDKFTWIILTYLRKKRPARYKDIRYGTELSDSVVSSRLDLLKSYKLIKVTPVVTEDKSFFEYKLTPKGVDLVKELELEDFMRRLRKIVPNFK